MYSAQNWLSSAQTRHSEPYLCRNRALEQARQHLMSEFAAERDTLLREVQLTRQQQQEALAQAQRGACAVLHHNILFVLQFNRDGHAQQSTHCHCTSTM